ncbi:hypothetical protein Cus16_1544 [Curtobacterium sp. ER1/6]|nr:hypothetical protein Cus16_1544 [Curtobacterium sp. ER1/6]
MPQAVRCRDGRVRVLLVHVGVATDDLGELLGVRLHQVDPLPGLQQRGERDARRVDRDADVVAVPPADRADEHGEGVVGQPGRERTGEDDPAGGRSGRRRARGVGDERGEVVEPSGQRGAGLVELRRRAGRLGDGDVRPQRRTDRQREGRDAPGRQAEQDGVELVARQDGEGVAPARDDHAGHVDALAAGLGRGAHGTLDGATLQLAAELDRAVEGRVGRHGDDAGAVLDGAVLGPHATTTSTSASASATARSAGGSWSVTSVSISSRRAKRMSASTPCFAASASTTLRRAARTYAPFTPASYSSGVLSPKPADRPFVPTKATSGRRPAICSTVAVPTAALVTPRTRPPSRWSSTWALCCRTAAIGTELVTTVRVAPGVAGSHRASSAATAAQVVPASRAIEPVKVDGTSRIAARAIAVFAVPCCPSRSATLSSTTLDRPTGTAPPCTRRRTPAVSRASRSRRTVSVVTSKCSARSATDTRPAECSAAAMASCRSVAYMPELLRSRWFQELYVQKQHERNCCAGEPTRTQRTPDPQQRIGRPGVRGQASNGTRSLDPTPARWRYDRWPPR